MSFVRLTLGAVLVLALTACGGGSGIGGILGGLNPTPQCNPGTQVELASPTAGQTGVSTTIGRVMIVANSNNNTLYSTYSNWNLTLTDQNGNTITGSNLSLVPGNGFTPYGSDFYYASSFSQLPAGMTWTVRLQEYNGSSCTAVPLQSFST